MALLSIFTMAGVAYRISGSNLERLSLDQLTSVRELKGRQIESYFRTIRDQVITLSESRMVVGALGEFTAAGATLRGELPNPDDDLELRLYYQNEFLPRLEQGGQGGRTLSEFWPEDALGRSLQSLYIAANPFEADARHTLDRSPLNTQYDAVHEVYHPLLRSFLERFGYYDLFLIDAATDRIVYSVFKEVDFGTSLSRGPYRDSNLASAYRAALGAGVNEFTRLEDFQPYDPSYGAQASFISSPIMDGGDVAGVLVFQLPIDRINDVMTSGRDWRSMGLGETGETYLVGSDERLRTESRFLVEAQQEYLEAIRGAGVPEATLHSIEAQGSAIGLQPVQTEGTELALSGATGVARFLDYRGVEVFSSFRPLDVPDLDWVIMSEIDASEALAPVAEQRGRMLFWLAGLLPLLGALAFWFSGNLTRPIRALSVTASELAEGHLETKVTVDRGDEIGDLARSLEVMRRSLRDLIERQNRSIDALSTPLIPIQDDVVVLPIVGELDQSRCDRLRESLTQQLHDNGSRYAILDLTGVPDLEKDVAVSLIRVAQSVRLLGAHAIVSGVRPELAGRLADLDIDMQGVTTARTLRDAVEFAVQGR